MVSVFTTMTNEVMSSSQLGAVSSSQLSVKACSQCSWMVSIQDSVGADLSSSWGSEYQILEWPACRFLGWLTYRSQLKFPFSLHSTLVNSHPADVVPTQFCNLQFVFGTKQVLDQEHLFYFKNIFKKFKKNSEKFSTEILHRRWNQLKTPKGSKCHI